MKNNLCLLLLVTFLGTITAQNDRLLPPKKLKKDLKELVAVIEAHPAPYRHITEDQLNALIDSTKNLLEEPMTMLDFYKLMSPIYSAIKDGHTSVRLPRKWMYNYRKKHGVFPFKVHLTDDNHLHIIDNYSDDKTIALGSEILGLNGVLITTFLEDISPYIAYEQENFRNSQIQTNFDMYLLLYFGQIKQIEIDYLSDIERKHTVDYIAYKDWKDELEEEEVIRRKKIAISKPYEFKKIKEGIGLLKIYSFAFASDVTYKGYLRTMFGEIKKDSITSLIIDVRGNTGGFPKTVSDLIHYISDKYFKTMAISEMKVSYAYRKYFQDRYNYNFYQYTRKGRRHHIDLMALFNEEIGTMVKEEASFNEPPKEMQNEFTGDVFLLIDKRSFSASSSFAATIRCYQLGILIGEETGGTKVFHANNMYKKLPHSGIVCGMATTRKYTGCFHEEDEGIKPDLPVVPTIPQLVAKQDVALNYSLRVISKAKRLREQEKKKQVATEKKL